MSQLWLVRSGNIRGEPGGRGRGVESVLNIDWEEFNTNNRRVKWEGWEGRQEGVISP